jgi:hypothetical protein
MRQLSSNFHHFTTMIFPSSSSCSCYFCFSLETANIDSLRSESTTSDQNTSCHDSLQQMQSFFLSGTKEAEQQSPQRLNSCSEWAEGLLGPRASPI